MTPRQVYYTDNVMPAIFKKETKVIKLPIVYGPYCYNGLRGFHQLFLMMGKRKQSPNN